MTKAIAISLIVIAVLGAAILSPITFSEDNVSLSVSDTGGSYFFSKIVDTTYHKVGEDTVTAFSAKAVLRVELELNEFNLIQLSGILYDGRIDVDIGTNTFSIVSVGIVEYLITIEYDDKYIYIDVGGEKQKIPIQPKISGKISFSGKACRISDNQQEVNQIIMSNGDSLKIPLANTVLSIGHGSLIDNNYVANFFECGDFYSAILHEDYDLTFFIFRVNYSQIIELTVNEELFSFADFVIGKKLKIISQPSENAIIIGENTLTFTMGGQYVFSFQDDYSIITYKVTYIDKSTGEDDGSGESTGEDDGSGESGGEDDGSGESGGEDDGGGESGGEDDGGGESGGEDDGSGESGGEDDGGGESGGEDDGGGESEGGGDGDDDNAGGGGVEVIIGKINYSKIVIVIGITLAVTIMFIMMCVWLLRRKK